MLTQAPGENTGSGARLPHDKNWFVYLLAHFVNIGTVFGTATILPVIAFGLRGPNHSFENQKPSRVSPTNPNSGVALFHALKQHFRRPDVLIIKQALQLLASGLSRVQGASFLGPVF